jgi:Ni/Co efflux regulator RcnB
MKKLILSLVALSVLTTPMFALTASPAKADDVVVVKEKRHHHHHHHWRYRHHHDHDHY